MNLSCLICLKPLSKSQNEYHPSCIKKLFGSKILPQIDFGLKQIEKLAKEEVNQRISIPGVQPKLSLNLKKVDQNLRLTTVGLWGNYIFKPPTKDYPALPEIEHLTMCLAQSAGINVALNGLIKLKSGELGFVCKRFDRIGNEKLAVEDFCQLTEQLTQSKYQSSMEKIGKAILRFSNRPVLDVITFFEITLFCFLVGNADMHLKNFSLMTDQVGETFLAPAYDLVATKLVLAEDLEEMALPINGKKNKLSTKDFRQFGQALSLKDNVIDNSFENLRAALESFPKIINASYIPKKQKNLLQKIIKERSARLFRGY